VAHHVRLYYPIWGKIRLAHIRAYRFKVLRGPVTAIVDSNYWLRIFPILFSVLLVVILLGLVILISVLRGYYGEEFLRNYYPKTFFWVYFWFETLEIAEEEHLRIRKSISLIPKSGGGSNKRTPL